ncbi:MAG: hypothetical protein QME51_08305, partial [Planctomycetota bacterium]|nr:hypothetical protein [Planctomycetota bacterium]
AKGGSARSAEAEARRESEAGEKASRPAINEAPTIILVPLTFCALITIILGLSPNAFVRLFELAKLTVSSITGC